MDAGTLQVTPPTPITTTVPASSNGMPATNATVGASMLVQLTTDGVPKLHCPVCNKALVSLNGYVKHLKKHEPPGGFLCRYCDARFCSEDEQKRHRDEEHTTITCRICKDVFFTKEEDYRAHIRDKHNGIDRELLKCDKCGAEYKTIDPYKRHMDTQCGTIKPHKCDQCPMSFVTKYNLKQHKESHTGERRYCCSYCGKNFMQKGRLVEHERSHTGEKPYKCDVCGKCFAHRESIVTHSSIHTGVRLVECRCCLSRFSCYSNLIKHRRTRPDNCGLPQYDPPKNRIRTHRPRIPPTLNPTSEIKVSNFNKIIKPDVKEIVRKIPKKETVETPLVCPTARKRTGRRPGRPPKKKTKKNSTGSENDEVEDVLCDSESSLKPTLNISTTDIPKRETRLTRANATPQNEFEIEALDEAKSDKSAYWNDSGSDEDGYADFDPADSDCDEDRKDDVKLAVEKSPPIKKELPDTGTDMTEAQMLCINHNDDLEFCDEREFIATDYNVKSEDGTNIFNDKDKLIECLLNESSASNKLNTARIAKDHQDQHGDVKEECDMLEETEVILIKDERGTGYAAEEVDMLDLKNHEEVEIDKCNTHLNDGNQRYPKSKQQLSAKVGRNLKQLRHKKQQPSQEAQEDNELAKLLKAEAKPTKRGKYRKRHEPDPSRVPGRMAKITQQELKARLKMLKQEETAWQCPHCIKVYYMRKPFEKHLRDHHRLPEDEIQKAVRKGDDGLSNGEVFKCEVCDKIYLVEKRLIAHKKLHGPDGNLIFKCPCYCSLYFATKDEAILHAQQQHRELIYCNICEKFMTGHDSLKNHMRAIHQCDNSKMEQARNTKRNLVCDKCGKKFSGRTSLTDHVRSDCGRKPLYQCTVCGKHLTTAGILKTHLLLHKDDTPYQCDQCGKTFKVKAQYKTHIKTRHTDYKPFKCHLCPKAYPYRESLLTHMTVHTGIKRFLCNGCGKRFTCISNLQAHRKVHADTCGQLPLNAKATQYMGVQKGNLLLGAKPEAGVDYKETNTLLAREVIDRDLPAAQELNYPSEPTAPLATVPLNYTQASAQQLLLPQLAQPFEEDSHSHASSYN